MDWFVFALLAPMFWAGCAIIDKIFLMKYIKNPLSYLILVTISAFVILPLIFISTEISFIFPWNVLSLIGGFFVGFSIWFYNKAMSIEEASRVIPMRYLGPIFVIVLANLFLGESLGLTKYMGVLLLVIGAVLISYQKTKGKGLFSPALKFILVFAFLMSCNDVLAKYILGFIDYWSFLFWHVIGSSSFGIFLLFIPGIRKRFIKYVSKLNKKIFVLRFLGLSLFFIGTVFYYIAVSSGFISLVSGMTSLSPFFVLIYSVIFSLFFPRILMEKIGKSTILLKLSAICLVFIGAWIIAS